MPPDPIPSLIASALLLPPGPSIALLLAALLLRPRRPRQICLALALASLYLPSTHAVSGWLRGRLEEPAPAAPEYNAAGAIVVLGAGRRHDAPEYGGGDTIAGFGLERLRYAAWLHKKTGLPVLASGGATRGEPVPEAELMREVLGEFGVETRWTEGRSRNTYENAVFSSQLLKGIGIGEVLLVTHAWHMPRAKEAFERAGVRVVPAPTGSMGAEGAAGLEDWLPDASALRMSCVALHEMLGRAWYRHRYYGKAGRGGPD